MLSMEEKGGATGDKEEKLNFNKILKAKCGWVYQLSSWEDQKRTHTHVQTFF